MKNWKIKTAVTICGNVKTHDEEIKDRMERRGWVLGARFQTTEEAISEVMGGRASVILVEDTRTLPTPLVLRQLMATPLGFMTPVLASNWNTNQFENSCMHSFGVGAFYLEPSSPSKFIEHFEHLIQSWTDEDRLNLYRAGLGIVMGKQAFTVKTLNSLITNKDPRVRVNAGIAMGKFFEASNLKTAEKLLLNLLSHSKKHMGVVLSLVDLYLRNAMPGYAIRLLNNAYENYNEPRMLLPDLAQSYLLLNEPAQAIPIFKKMVDEDYLADVGEMVLPRLYYCQGYESEFNQLVRSSPGASMQYDLAWGKSTSPKKTG